MLFTEIVSGGGYPLSEIAKWRTHHIPSTDFSAYYVLSPSLNLSVILNFMFLTHKPHTITNKNER